MSKKKKVAPKKRREKRPPLEPKVKKDDNGKILTDPHRVRSDIKLVDQSIKKNWGVRGSEKKLLRHRMIGIALKTVGEAFTKEGVMDSETVADKLAIDATKVIVAMDAQDIARTKMEIKPTTTVNVTNNVSNTLDARQLALVELANKFGARELVINGKSIPTSTISGGDSDIQGAGEVDSSN